MVWAIFLSGEVGSHRSGFSIRIKFGHGSVQLVLFPIFLGQGVAFFIPRAGGALFFSKKVKSFRFLCAGGKILRAEPVELAILPVGGVAGKAVGPPTGGSSVELIGGVEKIIGDGAVGMKESGGALPFALKKCVGGAGFSIVPEEDLGAGHLAGLHPGFGLQLSVGRVEEPVALGQASANRPLSGFLSFFIQVDAAAVALIGLAKFAAIDGFIGSVEEEFDLAGFTLSRTEGELTLQIAVGSFAEDLGGDEGCFVVVPNGVAGGLVGGIGKLVGAIDRAADGLGRLQPLQDGVDDQPHLGLGENPRGK